MEKPVLASLPAGTSRLATSGEAFQLELSGYGVVYVQASERKI